MLTLPSRNASTRRRQKSYGDHDKFLSRVSKTLCFGKYPKSDSLSLPATEFAAELFSRAKNKLSLDLLDVEEAARLTRRASVSTCSLVLALIYLDRLKASNPKYLAKIPPSQLFLISLMVGSKFIQDDGQDDEVNNCEWAAHAGLTVQDINRAEKEFLDAIQWEVYVSEKAFWRRLEAMERVIAFRQGSNRGWFSYTELDILLKSAQIGALLKTLFNLSVICMASYSTTVFAVMGSTMMVANLSPGLVSMATNRPFSESPASSPHLLPTSAEDSAPPVDLHSLSLPPADESNERPLVSNGSSKCPVSNKATQGQHKYVSVWEELWKYIHSRSPWIDQPMGLSDSAFELLISNGSSKCPVSNEATQGQHKYVSVWEELGKDIHSRSPWIDPPKGLSDCAFDSLEWNGSSKCPASDKTRQGQPKYVSVWEELGKDIHSRSPWIDSLQSYLVEDVVRDSIVSLPL